MELTSLIMIVSHYSVVMVDNHCCNSFYNFIRINGEKLFYILDIDDKSYFNLNEFLHVGSDFVGYGLYSNISRINSQRISTFKAKKHVIFHLN